MPPPPPISDSIENPSAKAAAQERVGTDINAKWRLDGLLGVGGMGAVFAATHKNNGSRAALKVLHIEFSKVDDIRERFLREGRIANRVDHTSRVAVLDDDMSDRGEPFLVMELLEGMTLADLYRKSRYRVPLDNLFKVFDPVLELLGKAHELGIVHRDIKPANVFLSKDGPVKVLDFGVARMREPQAGVQATRAGIALGTASYIAPEQALGVEAIDGRADLWSVGACIYTGITGIRLHAAKTEAEEFVLAATQAVASIAREASDLPAPIVAFVDKALSYDRNQRYASAAEMRTDLLGLIAGVRSGQLQRSAAAKKQGVVVRGNEVVEGAEHATEKETERAANKVGGIFKLLSVAMQNIRQYGFHHPQTKRSMETTFAEIGGVLHEDPTAVRWDVSAGAFFYDGYPVWEPDRVPFDRIPHQLFADGIRKVQFKPGMTEQELADFTAILLRDGGVGGAEDDSVTALWDRRFEHIAYLAVDSWAEGDEDDDSDEPATAQVKASLVERQALTDELLSVAQIDKDLDDSSLELQAAEMNLASKMRESGEAAAALAVDAGMRASLGAQIRATPEHFFACYVDTFVPAYLEGEREGDTERLFNALTEWTEDQVSLHAADQAFELHQAVVEAFRKQVGDDMAQELDLSLAKLMFPPDRLKAVMNDFATERRGPDGERLPVSPAMVSGLGRMLELLADETVFGLACECLDAGRSAELSKVVEPYLAKFLKGNEGTMSGMFSRVGEETGILFVRMLADRGPEAVEHLERAFESPHVRVRIAALVEFGENPGDRARQELSALLDNEKPELRKEALGHVGQMKLVSAGPLLVRKVQSDEFNALPVDERKLWLEAIAGMKPERAEELAVELLTKRRIFGGDAADQTRRMAAEFLSTSSSESVHAALASIVKQRLATSAALREVAEKAAASVQRNIEKSKGGAEAKA